MKTRDLIAKFCALYCSLGCMGLCLLFTFFIWWIIHMHAFNIQFSRAIYGDSDSQHHQLMIIW